MLMAVYNDLVSQYSGTKHNDLYWDVELAICFLAVDLATINFNYPPSDNCWIIYVYVLHVLLHLSWWRLLWLQH